jgi:hypothetical protein
MPLTDGILDEAYSIFEEFGPDRLIDRRERLKSVFADLTAEELDRLMLTMKAVTHTVWQLAEKGGEIKLGKEAVSTALIEAYPFLQDKGLSRAAMLVNYFAWHEGYDR